MLSTLRQFVVFQLFLTWQGGFFFYSAVVVPIGTEVLGSRVIQGTITQQVTYWLNLIGGLWCLAMLWDWAATRQHLKWRLPMVLLCAVLLVALLVIRHWLNDWLDVEKGTITDKQAFRFWHVTYLWISTIHWLLGLVLAWLTLAAWRAERGNPSA